MKRTLLLCVTVLALLCPSLSFAQADDLTQAQLTTLKNDIAADGTLNALPNTEDANQQIANAYNATASPDFWVWRTKVCKDEYTQSVSVDSTTFAWTGAGYITRSQGERDAFDAIFDSRGCTNPSLVNVRTAFTDIFSGATAPAPANRTHLSTVSRRKATRFEKLYATGTGSTVSPASLVLERQVQYWEVARARTLP